MTTAMLKGLWMAAGNGAPGTNEGNHIPKTSVSKHGDLPYVPSCAVIHRERSPTQLQCRS